MKFASAVVDLQIQLDSANLLVDRVIRRAAEENIPVAEAAILWPGPGKPNSCEFGYGKILSAARLKLIIFDVV